MAAPRSSNASWRRWTDEAVDLRTDNRPVGLARGTGPRLADSRGQRAILADMTRQHDASAQASQQKRNRSGKFASEGKPAKTADIGARSPDVGECSDEAMAWFHMTVIWARPPGPVPHSTLVEVGADGPVGPGLLECPPSPLSDEDTLIFDLEEDVDLCVYLNTDRNVVLRGAAAGSLMVGGPGNGNVHRDGDGNGTAALKGSGDGNCIRSGNGNGDAHRSGSGNGFVYRSDRGDGWAIRFGDGDGNADRGGSGNGSAKRAGAGTGDVARGGEWERERPAVWRR